MKNSLQDFLTIVYPSLSSELTGSVDRAKMECVSQLLPNIPVIVEACFECHLTKERPSTDLLVAFARSSRSILLEAFEALPSLVNRGHSWKKIGRLIETWLDKDSYLHQNIDNIWLEFDTGSSIAQVPEPSIFFAPTPSGIELEKNSTNFTKYDRTIGEALELLMDESISSKTKECLSRCFDFLPVGGKIFQVGVMLPRVLECRAIKLCVEDIEISQIPEYLRSIGWSDSTGGLENLLNEISSITDFVAISIAIEDGVHPKIGIECYIDKQLKSTEKWIHFFDFMVEKKLCTRKEVTAILKWPGCIEEEKCEKKWPSNLSHAKSFMSKNFKSVAIRTINHVKFVYQPGIPLQAKAYLFFGHRWIDSNGSIE